MRFSFGAAAAGRHQVGRIGRPEAARHRVVGSLRVAGLLRLRASLPLRRLWLWRRQLQRQEVWRLGPPGLLLLPYNLPVGMHDGLLLQGHKRRRRQLLGDPGRRLCLL